MSACAVYPEMHWNITLALGYGLEQRTAAPLVNAASAASIAQLPWFRHGYMPDWLRRLLVDGLPRADNRAVRRMLNALLLTAVRGGSGDLALQIVSEQSKAFERLAGFVRRLVARREDARPEWRDHVFVRFMGGRQSRSLAVRAPEAWRWLWRGSRAAATVIPVPCNRETRAIRWLAALLYPLGFISFIPALAARDRYLRFNAWQAVLNAFMLSCAMSLVALLRPSSLMPMLGFGVAWFGYLSVKAVLGRPALLGGLSSAALVWSRDSIADVSVRDRPRRRGWALVRGVLLCRPSAYADALRDPLALRKASALPVLTVLVAMIQTSVWPDTLSVSSVLAKQTSARVLIQSGR